jgi:hypothetical protein
MPIINFINYFLIIYKLVNQEVKMGLGTVQVIFSQFLSMGYEPRQSSEATLTKERYAFYPFSAGRLVKIYESN